MTSQPLLTEADFSPPLTDDPALEWGKEEPRENVEVDQRALIEKILARYSTKFPVLRELLQNADDAEAKHAFIRFESKSFVSGYSHSEALDLEVPIHRWTVYNDGKIFSVDDWERLKTIADGNPDEHKIGTFGVGFYSVFSVTDLPTVKSGGKKMRFHWGGKDNKRLFISRSRLSSTSLAADKWTTIELPTHTPSQMPGSIIEIGHFLTDSLPFMSSIEAVTVALDSHSLLRIHKHAETPLSIKLLDGLNPVIAEGLMKVSKLVRKKITIEANDYTSSVPRSNGMPISPDTPKIVSSSIMIHVLDARVAVSLDAEIEAGLQKVTKKELVRNCHFQMVYSANVEQKENGDHSAGNGTFKFIQGGESYIHIGHATMQTTGFAGQIAAPFIPTVERELIDFENGHVKRWNEGLLCVGGYVARTIYEYEMALSEEKKANSDIHPLRYFAFHESTPHEGVSKIIMESFFTCSDRSLSIFSSHGLRPAAEVLDYDPDCSFFKNVPMLTLQVVQEAPEMIGLLKKRGVVKSASLGDLELELSDYDRLFTESEIISCLQWVLKAEAVTGDTAESFLHIARFQHCLSSRRVELRQIRTVLVPEGPEFSRLIQSGEYLPEHTLPYEVSKELQVDRLVQLIQLFGWKNLGVIKWLENLTSLLSPSEPGSISGTIFAELCFNVLMSAWSGLGEVDKERIKELLKDLECIPTQEGMKRPQEAYLWGCSFFGLPTVTIPESGVVRLILEFLELNRNIEFYALLDAACEVGNTFEALPYLLDNFAQYMEDHGEEVIKESISKKAFIPATNGLGERRMVTVSEAFIEPSCQKMGFWIVDRRFRRDIAKLGVYNHPPSSQLINRLKVVPPSSTSVALQYFDYLYSRMNDFTEQDFVEWSSLPFVPVDPETPRLISPKNCYLGKPRSILYSKLFEFVNLTDSGNKFLEKCKAKQEPTTDDIARALAADPNKFFQCAGGRNGLSVYMRELNGLAQNRKDISKDTTEELKKASAFVGFPYKCFEMAFSKSGIEGNLRLASSLLRADEIVIVDDSRNYAVFQFVPGLFHAPKDLEVFYLELGSPRLSRLVDETYDPGDSNELFDTWRARETRELVIQRLRLFLPTVDNPECEARFQFLFKDQNFVVRVFDKLMVKKELKFGSIMDVKNCDAAAGYWSDDGIFELLLANDSLDYFEIACCIAKIFFGAPSTNIYLLLLTLLSSSLTTLRQRGYNVDLEALELTTPAGPLYTMNFSSESLTDGERPPSVYRSESPKHSFAPLDFDIKSRKTPATAPVTWDNVEKDLEDTLEKAPGFQSSTAIRMKKEKANKSCGGSQYRGDLHYIKKCGPFSVYVGKDLTLQDIKDKKTCIECFVSNVIDPLKGVFHCVPEIVRVLYDRNCQDLAALNRSGEIYLNLANFEKDYYQDEIVKNPAAALVSWYFILAHEITHNFVPTHNALFEMIYSGICQKYVLQLFKLDPLRKAINDESRFKL